jgi:hypothetical protein
MFQKIYDGFDLRTVLRWNHRYQHLTEAPFLRYGPISLQFTNLKLFYVNLSLWLCVIKLHHTFSMLLFFTSALDHTFFDKHTVNIVIVSAKSAFFLYALTLTFLAGLLMLLCY